MKVTRFTVAEHLEMDEEDVMCENCEYRSKQEPHYCIYWDLKEDANDKDDFCAYFLPINYIRMEVKK